MTEDILTFRLVAMGSRAALYDIFLNGKFQSRTTLFHHKIHLFTLQ